MDVCAERDVHPVPTHRSGRRYCFTPKHHGAGSSGDAQWLPSLTRAEEFEVFNMGDVLRLVDEDGDIYGLHIVTDGTRRDVMKLGTREELVGRFWEEDDSAPWHGHPLWPLLSKRAGSRGQQKMRPPWSVFEALMENNILSEAQAGRIYTGRHIKNINRIQ